MVGVPVPVDTGAPAPEDRPDHTNVEKLRCEVPHGKGVNKLAALE